MEQQLFPVDLPVGAAAPHLWEALADVVPRIIIAECLQLAAEHVSTGSYMARFAAEGAVRYPYSGDPDAVAVVNTSPHADIVENGHAGFHLPSRWGAGGGVWKVGKDGRRYARVMFRHGAPVAAGQGASAERSRTQMPPEIYARARRLAPGDRLYDGGPRQSKSYVYYRTIFGGLPQELEDILRNDPQPEGYTWRTAPYAGMVHVLTPTPGGSTHGRYVTFRTITPDSPGWYIPPSPGLHIMQRAIQNCAPEIWDAIDRAVAADLAALALDAVDPVV